MALLLLILIEMKRSGDIKLSEYSRKENQLSRTDKSEYSSPTSDFYIFKFIFTLIAKTNRNSAYQRNDKWVAYVACDKISCDTLNTTLMARKNLSKILKELKLIMSSYDPSSKNTLTDDR